MDRPAEPITTEARLGAIRIGFHPTHSEAAEIDRCGNPVGTRTGPVDLVKRSAERAEAALADVVADLVAWANAAGKPLVHEALDFR